MQTLQVNEIFVSLSGEPDGFGNQGGLATFVRLQGCNLTCKWCDTGYACTDDGQEMCIEDVLKLCETAHVILTGGEPLLQRKGVIELVEQLVATGHWITIETNGTQKLPQFELTHPFRLPPVRYVVDYKLASSGMSQMMHWEFFDTLSMFDTIKFVIADENDYRQASILVANNPQWSGRIVFSPTLIAGSADMNHAECIVKAMIDDRLEFVNFAMQLHKLVNIK